MMYEDLIRYSPILSRPNNFVLGYNRKEWNEKGINAQILNTWLLDGEAYPLPDPDPEWVYLQDRTIIEGVIASQEFEELSKIVIEAHIKSYTFHDGFFKFVIKEDDSSSEYDEDGMLWVQFHSPQSRLLNVLVMAEEHPEVIPYLNLVVKPIAPNVFVLV